MKTPLWSMKGRIGRGAFLRRCVAATPALVGATLICKANVETNGPFLAILASVLVQAACAAFVVIQGVKRMHDVNRDPLLLFVPIYGLVVALTVGTPEVNRNHAPPDEGKL